MTKYIDRYYLNWEMYGIKFPEPGWQPWANTLVYYDFETDTSSLINKASSWSTYDGTYYSTPTFWTTANGKRYFNCGWNNYATTPVIPFSLSNTTIVMWMYFNGFTDGFLFGTWWYASPTLWIAIQWVASKLSLWMNKKEWGIETVNEYKYAPYPSWWHLVTCVIDGITPKWYIDKTLVYTWSLTTSWNNQYNVWIWTLYEQKHQYTRSFKWYYWSVIIENAQWIKQEIDDYFDLTKSLYGIS